MNRFPLKSTLRKSTKFQSPDPFFWTKVRHLPCQVAQYSGGTERATSVNTSLLRLQSSEGKFTTSREIEPVRRSFRRRRSCTFTEAARLVPSGVFIWGFVYNFTNYDFGKNPWFLWRNILPEGLESRLIFWNSRFGWNYSWWNYSRIPNESTVRLCRCAVVVPGTDPLIHYYYNIYIYIYIYTSIYLSIYLSLSLYVYIYIHA